MVDLTFSNELVLLISVFTGLTVIVAFYFLFKFQGKLKAQTEEENLIDQRPTARRAVGNRNRIRGGQAAVPRQGGPEVENHGGIDNGSSSLSPDLSDPKMGAKKRAKLEAKAEKKALRETETKLREKRKLQQEKEEVERRLLEEKEKIFEEKLELEKRKAEEDKMRKQEEEYQKMKSAFLVEEEGFDEEGDDEEGNLLQEFISYIKEKKVVMLEDLAARFHLKIQTVISRIDELLLTGALTGVIDDRGKFIYITVDELKAVADFIKKRGRVSIQELVENSNNLISLK